MASSGKRKTTMAKLNRERRLLQRRLEKQAKKEARKQASADPGKDEDRVDSIVPGARPEAPSSS